MTITGRGHFQARLGLTVAALISILYTLSYSHQRPANPAHSAWSGPPEGSQEGSAKARAAHFNFLCSIQLLAASNSETTGRLAAVARKVIAKSRAGPVKRVLMIRKDSEGEWFARRVGQIQSWPFRADN